MNGKCTCAEAYLCVLRKRTEYVTFSLSLLQANECYKLLSGVVADIP
jgi:hypothetical protein